MYIQCTWKVIPIAYNSENIETNTTAFLPLLRTSLDGCLQLLHISSLVRFWCQSGT